MTGSASQMRWMVGVDARALSVGAVALARWLSRAEANVVCGVHVIKWVPEVEPEPGLGGPRSARRRVSELLGPVADDPCFDRVEAIEAGSVEEGLRAAIAAQAVHALVLGRRAPSDGRVGALRLGRVGRRIVRDLPSPVVVVPPDFEPSGHGPVIVATDFTPACEHALRWALSVAEAMARAVVLVHVLPPPDVRPYRLATAPEGAQAGGESCDAFGQWAERHGAAAVERVRLEGRPLDALLSFAREREACVLVTGSRGLDGVERLYLSSLGTELAATGPLPVALVPVP